LPSTRIAGGFSFRIAHFSAGETRIMLNRLKSIIKKIKAENHCLDFLFIRYDISIL
jgi:hypothetical protein